MSLDPLTLRWKRLHPLAVLPSKAHVGDAAFDLFAPEHRIIFPRNLVCVPLGISTELPENYYAQIRGRSGLGAKGIIVLAGVVDPGFRGQWQVIFYHVGREGWTIRPGDKIAQFTLHECPEVRVVEVDELTTTERGEGGFGSTDDDGPCPNDHHQWVRRRVGGAPDMAESCEVVEVCDVCGIERVED